MPEITVDIPIAYIIGGTLDYYMIDLDKHGLPVWEKCGSGTVALCDDTTLGFLRCERVDDTVSRFVL